MLKQAKSWTGQDWTYDYDPWSKNTWDASASAWNLQPKEAWSIEDEPDWNANAWDTGYSKKGSACDSKEAGCQISLMRLAWAHQPNPV